MQLPYVRVYKHNPCNRRFGWQYTQVVLGRHAHAIWFFVGFADVVVII